MPRVAALPKAVKTGVDRCIATVGIDARLLAVQEKTSGVEVRWLFETHHLAEMGKREQLVRAPAVCLRGCGVVIPINVKAAQLTLALQDFKPVRHQKVPIAKGPVETAQLQEEIRIGQQDVVFQIGDVIKRLTSAFSQK